MEKDIFDAEVVQKAHTFEEEKDGVCIRMALRPVSIERTIKVLNEFKKENNEYGELCDALVADYQAALDAVEANDDKERASLLVAPVDGKLLEKAFRTFKEINTLDEEMEDLVRFMIQQDEILFHMNHDLSTDEFFKEDDDYDFADEDLPN